MPRIYNAARRKVPIRIRSQDFEGSLIWVVEDQDAPALRAVIQFRSNLVSLAGDLEFGENPALPQSIWPIGMFHHCNPRNSVFMVHA